MELHKWSGNVVNVESRQFLKEGCKFLSVIWVKWKLSVFSVTLLYSSTFYSLFLPIFVLVIFKFKYDKVFVRHSASISKFEWPVGGIGNFAEGNFLPGSENLSSEEEQFWQFEPLSKLRTAFWEYWTSINKITTSMTCVPKEFEIKTKSTATGVMAPNKNYVFIGL